MKIFAIGSIYKSTDLLKVPKNGPVSKQHIADAFVHLLILIKLIDENNFPTPSKSPNILMKKIAGQNRRSLDLNGAKSYI